MSGMYRGLALVCPACRGALEYIGVSLPVHGCGACGGLWLGPEATIDLLRGRAGALANALVEADRRALHGPRSQLVVPDGAPRHCPACELEMGALQVGNVRIDSCPTHGAWFDHLEATRVTTEILTLERRARGELPTLRELITKLWSRLT